MSLQSLIANGNYESAQTAFDAITAATIEVRDDQFYTWNGIAKVAGKQNVKGITDALYDAGFEAFVIQLGGKGLQLTDSDVREMLGFFVANGLPGAQALLDQGISFVTPYKQAGIDEPTLQQVTVAWNAWKAETDLVTLRDSLRVRFDAILNQIGTVEQVDAIADLRSIANELEA
jgi:hypothetical protein